MTLGLANTSAQVRSSPVPRLADRVAAMDYIVIVAGGSGSRLWPISRQGEPKQLLDLVQGTSLLRAAFVRVRTLVPAEQILICTGAAYADRVREQIPEVPEQNVLGEPTGRDSLAAMAWPAAVLAGRDPDAVMAVVSADQVIEPAQVFAERLGVGLQVAATHPEALVVFGVVPTDPNTGYGYLRRGPALDGYEQVNVIEEFKEKPDLETATQYLASGRYWWNGGMFAWRVDTFLRLLGQLQPTVRDAVVELAAHPERLEQIYPGLTRISVDFAVMEPVSAGVAPATIVGVALPVSWYDIGSYASLAAHLPHDEQGNALEGQVVAVDAGQNVLVNRGGDGHVLAVSGVSNLVVVTTPHATLVLPAEQSQQVKQLVGAVVERFGPEHG